MRNLVVALCVGIWCAEGTSEDIQSEGPEPQGSQLQEAPAYGRWGYAPMHEDGGPGIGTWGDADNKLECIKDGNGYVFCR